MAPAWLLAVLVFLCLGLGGDAITCHYCYTNNPNEKCDTSVKCSLDGGSCLTTLRYEGQGSHPVAINKGCAVRTFKKCGTRKTTAPDVVIQHNCCNNASFCNS